MSDPLIHPTAVVDPPSQIGPGTRIWHFCHLMAGCRIGADCSLGQNVFVGAGVRVGDRVKIQNNVSLYTGVEIEDEVFIGPSAVFTNVRTPRATVPRNTEAGRGATLVRRGASVGANATIVCGVTIGRFALIGAGAVVTQDVPDHALVLGNPARQQAWVCRCGAVFQARGDTLVCPECGRTATQAGDGWVFSPDAG